MEGRAKKMGLTVWRNCDMKQKPHSIPTKRVIWQAPGKTGWKRVTYENKFPVVQTLNSVEIESNFKHISKGTKVMLGNFPMTPKDDVIGNMGMVVCRYLALNQYHQTIYHFHFRAAINFDSAGSKEAQILSKLNMNRSHNAMRVMRYGQYLNLQYILTQELSSDLGFIVQNTTLDLFSSVHLIQQTFYCISDLHKIGYTHLDIRPSSFSLLRNNKAVVVLNSFFNSETRQNISRNIRTTKHNGLQPLYVQQARHARNKSEREPLPKNVINTYMSRRQHFRLARGPADDYESWFYICARFITLLNKNRSHNAMRVMKYGQYLNLQYILTQELSSDLGFIVQNTKLDLYSAVHLIQQTFYCISDLHKIGYTHLDIRPSSFSLLRNNKAVVVLNNFFNSETRQNISRNIRTTKHNGLQPLYVQQSRHARNKSEREPLSKNVINTYLSRRQHFRLARGPADDYESWFYICARFITLETFEWHDEEDHIVAATMKYNYLATCTFPDPDTNERMAKILQYCLSATNTNANVVAFYLERVIQNWKENIPPKEFYSWQDTDSVNTKHEAWMERNKTWYAPRKPRCAEY